MLDRTSHTSLPALLALVAIGLTAPPSTAQVVQSAYIKAIAPDDADEFARSIAISGEWIAIGAPFEDSSAVGVGGDPLNQGAPDSGAVYLLTQSAAILSHSDYVKASNTGSGDEFGRAVALDGDTLVVGAPGEDSGDPADPVNNGAPGSGAVYVFRRSPAGVWSQEAYLKASNLDAGDRFGATVALDGDLLVVGAPEEDSATGANGADNTRLSAGAAYAFRRTGGVWSEMAYLKPNVPDAGDLFGDCVALDDGIVVVGAPREDGGSTIVSGDETDNSAFDAGAAFVFGEIGGVWMQRSYLKAANAQAGDYFGDAVDVDLGRILVGAPFEDSASPGVNGDPSDNSQFSAGAAYTFRIGLADWFQAAYLKASLPGSFDRFGTALAISGDRIAVGAFGERSAATGINGDPTNNNAGTSGAVYLYSPQAFPWGLTDYIKASNTDSIDRFGVVVALEGRTLISGAPTEDSDLMGVSYGAGGANSSPDSGAAYAFDVLLDPFTAYCIAAVNSTGAAASMGATGTASIVANDLVLEATDVPRFSFGFFFTSRLRSFVVMPSGSQGNLCLGGSIGRYVGPGQIQNSGSAGRLTLSIDNALIPQPNGFVQAVAGDVWSFQAWFRDSIGGGATSNFTDALSVSFGG